jgi:hypothetical protein
MPGTANNFLTTLLTIGPCKFYTGLAVPAAASRLTLHTDDTPESVANPNAVHVGFTDQGMKFTYSTEIQKFEADEQTAPIFSRVLTEAAMLEGVMLQNADFNVLDELLMAGTQATGSGYEEITLGGNTTVTGISIAVIWATVAAAANAMVVNIYNAYNAIGMELNITRRELGKTPFRFEGQSVATRAVGDQLCNLWKQA